MTFNIYSAATGGTPLWTEIQSGVAVQNGVFSVQLGAGTSLSTVAFNQQYWIGVTNGGTEMSPRITLTAAPYAMGFKGTTNVFGSSGNVGIGTLNPSNKLTVVGGITADSVHSSNATVDATATIGVGNIGTLNAGSTTLSGLTVNGNTYITGNTTIGGGTIAANYVAAGGVGAVSNSVTAQNLLASGAISAGGATLATNSVSATGDVIAGGLYAAVGTPKIKIFCGTIAANGTILNGSGDFTVTHISTGYYRINYNTAVFASYAVSVIPYQGTGASDFRWNCWVNNYTNNSFQVGIENSTGTFFDEPFTFIAIVAR